MLKRVLMSPMTRCAYRAARAPSAPPLKTPLSSLARLDLRRAPGEHLPLGGAQHVGPLGVLLRLERLVERVGGVELHIQLVHEKGELWAMEGGCVKWFRVVKEAKGGRKGGTRSRAHSNVRKRALGANRPRPHPSICPSVPGGRA